MQPRLDFFTVAPVALKPLLALSHSVETSGLEKTLLELIKLRASQINGCAFCIDMHTKDARKNGETEQRLYLLSAWRESPLYTDRERAVLGWTEALTRLGDTHASDADYEALSPHFSNEEKVKLSMAIVTINSWNRLAIGFRSLHPV